MMKSSIPKPLLDTFQKPKSSLLMNNVKMLMNPMVNVESLLIIPPNYSYTVILTIPEKLPEMMFSLLETTFGVCYNSEIHQSPNISISSNFTSTQNVVTTPTKKK